jgi:hypothetical protein
LLELPRDEKYNENGIIMKIDKIVKKMKKFIETDFSFYIDNYEVPDNIKINGNDNYSYLIDSFGDFNIIPIIGFDRTRMHNLIGISYANKNAKKIAIRITYDYFNSFLAYKEDLVKMLSEIRTDVLCVIMLDCNYIDDSDVENYVKSMLKMLENIINIKQISKIVISGSSIPAPIGNKVKTNKNVFINRNEVDLFKRIKREYLSEALVFGDYTVVSPEYSEINVEPELIQNIMNSKIVYSRLNSHYICRGRPIKTYGFSQYFSHAKNIINESFFRGKDFSWGDGYLYEKAKYGGKNITPSTIIGPTINAHIKLMINEISKGLL